MLHDFNEVSRVHDDAKAVVASVATKVG